MRRITVTAHLPPFAAVQLAELVAAFNRWQRERHPEYPDLTEEEYIAASLRNWIRDEYIRLNGSGNYASN